MRYWIPHARSVIRVVTPYEQGSLAIAVTPDEGAVGPGSSPLVRGLIRGLRTQLGPRKH
jgi:hypothetical protein